jgi:hypothetical protein
MPRQEQQKTPALAVQSAGLAHSAKFASYVIP